MKAIREAGIEIRTCSFTAMSRRGKLNTQRSTFPAKIRRP
jgi:hypothetical protein